MKEPEELESPSLIQDTFYERMFRGRSVPNVDQNRQR